jgi:hypothetical protein
MIPMEALVEHTTKGRRNLIASVAFFFSLWPMGSLFLLIKHWKTNWAKNLFWLFCVYFGFTFIIDPSGEADSARYSQELIELSQQDMTLSNFKDALYSSESNYVDLVQPVLTFLVSRFTDNPKILFAVFGLIFGFFYSRNIWYILERLNGRITIIVGIFILVFVLLDPIFNINGFRMGTAMHVFLYGTLPFLYDGNKKRLFWSFFSVFVHFSMFIPLLLLAIYMVAGNRLSLYFWFFVIAYFFSELNLQIVRESLSYLPGIFRTRLESYIGDDYVKAVAESTAETNWYLLYYLKLKSWVLLALSVFLYYRARKIIKAHPGYMNLFCFALLMCGLAKILSSLPSGGRFGIIGNLFMFALFTLFFSVNRKIRFLKELQILSLPVLILFIFVSIRLGLDYIGLATILGNPVTSILSNENNSLINSIRELF